MSVPKDASTQEALLRAAIEYRMHAAELSEAERLEVPAAVRKLAGPLPPRRAELSPVILLGFSWLLILLSIVLAVAVNLGVI